MTAEITFDHDPEQKLLERATKQPFDFQKTDELVVTYNSRQETEVFGPVEKLIVYPDGMFTMNFGFANGDRYSDPIELAVFHFDPKNDIFGQAIMKAKWDNVNRQWICWKFSHYGTSFDGEWNGDLNRSRYFVEMRKAIIFTNAILDHQKGDQELQTKTIDQIRPRLNEIIRSAYFFPKKALAIAQAQMKDIEQTLTTAHPLLEDLRQP